ncbi:leukocyte-specific transcript 1 protein isoform X2 [Cavia porcellus]|uniref:leukocyte-specific transcript 1 protein isoform X2 n=1 Tax=Cavia porcellus TaxID=10141 RepID=UPI000350FE38|nr:leukocyte-specific transcript 1 protein isoform X2 [Cavia porcellus]
MGTYCEAFCIGGLALGGLLLLLLLILAICLCRLKQRVRKLESSGEQELHYASLRHLSQAACSGGGSHRDAEKEDASTDYACIAEKRPT